MEYDFDEIIRQNSNSAKWHWYSDPEDVIPMWVADMDFKVPAEVQRELAKRVDEGIYGYTLESKSYIAATADWQREQHGWNVEEDWIISSPGVITSINLAIQAYSCVGDYIVIQTPIYHSFYNCILNNQRQILKNPLKLTNQGYEIDFDKLKHLFKNNKVKIFLLCNPHNPTGKVFSEYELESLTALCKEYNVIMVADEIHQDLVFSGNKHTTLGLFSNMYDNIIVLTSPTKTFNMAGLKVANTIIPNADIREKYLLQRKSNGPTSINIFGLIGCEAAYLYGHSWLSKAVAYIEANRDYAVDYIRKFLPQFEIVAPEATYFLWVDCTMLNMSDVELDNFFVSKAKIRISSGSTFGTEGEKFVRINVACPRQVLKKALESISIAIETLNI